MNEESLFYLAQQQPDGEARAVFLDQACANNRQLRARLEKLLQAYNAAVSLFDKPALDIGTTIDSISSPSGDSGPDSSMAPTASTGEPGTHIGPYKLLQQIGEGGMGAVWMAEQQQPVRRKVALKIIKPGMDSQQVIARFEAERQALALMDHLNIARVLDGGTTENDRPFFVMELIHGVPITKYCDRNCLTLRERLELFAQVCRAIHHAHQKGIIHRDIKPSNLLVTLYEGKPVPKVIDFGVAKAVEQHLTEKTLFTQYGAIIGTFEYMSPEQAETSALGVDTRSDIYSLGVLLYELLTGTTPLERQRLRAASYAEIVRLIREEEPTKPSTRLNHSETLPVVAAARKMEPLRLTKLVRGELDWIVMKALEKDRNRRYESASAFAADVQRYLHDEPILACPPSAWYRFRKFTQRKKTALIMAACIFLALAGTAGDIGWSMRDREAQKQEIEHERLAREGALDQLVQRALNEAAALLEQEKWPEALAVVERADKLLAATGRTQRPPLLLELHDELSMAKRLEEINRQPDWNFKAEELRTIDDAARQEVQSPFDSLEEAFFTGRQADIAFACAFRDFGIDIDALTPAAASARITRRRIRASLVKALDDWMPFCKQARGADNPAWKKCVEIARLADDDSLRNRCRESLLRRDRQALEKLAETVPIRQAPAKTLWLLGLTLKEIGSLDRAVNLLQRAQHRYPNDLWINDTLGNFHWMEFHPPHTEEALRFYSIALSLRPQRPQLHFMVAGILNRKGAHEDAILEYSRAIDSNPKYATALWNRAAAYRQLRQYENCLADRRRLVELKPRNARAHYNLGCAFTDLGKTDEAIVCFRRAIELDPKLDRPHINLGNAFRKKGDLDGAIGSYRKAIELDPKDAQVHTSLGLALAAKGDRNGAIASFHKAIELDPKNVRTHLRLGAALEVKGDLDGAIASFHKAIELDPKNPQITYNLGVALMAKGDLDGAIGYYHKAIKLDPKYAAAYSGLITLLRRQGRHEEAIAIVKKAVAIDPEFAAEAYFRLAHICHCEHDRECAITYYRKAVEHDPKHALATYWLGHCLLEERRHDEGLAYVKRGFQLYQRNIRRGMALANQLANAPDLKSRDPVGALHLAEAVVERAPKEGHGWQSLAWARYRNGDWKGAVTAITKAAELGSKGDSYEWFLLAMAHWQLGDKAEARQWYDRAVDWMDKNRPKNEQLACFRTEAARLMKIESKSD